MQNALSTLGARFTQQPDGTLLVTPATPPFNVPDGARINCGLAGTVMRFVPPLAVLANGPVTFDGDPAARRRPLAPALNALGQLGAQIDYHGEEDFLPFTLTPPSSLPEHAEVSVDSSSSSQFLSALLLLGPLLPGGLTIRTIGEVPSLPHVAMTVESLRATGCQVLEPASLPATITADDDGAATHDALVPAFENLPATPAEGSLPTPAFTPTDDIWHVSPSRPHGGEQSIEPDLSNAGPFLAAALVASGNVSIPGWPLHTTQAGDAWRELLPRLGGRITLKPDEPDHSSAAGTALSASIPTTAGVGNGLSHERGSQTATLTVSGTGHLNGIEADLSEVGELTPTVAALALLASAQGHASRLTGIAHLRGHETDRLAALIAEMTRLGGKARELPDGIAIDPLPDGEQLRPALMHSYADHRMATFAAIVGLAVPGITLDDVACTSKTLPDFPTMWDRLISAQEA